MGTTKRVRRGFTLAETLIASICTAAVVSAGTAMVVAVSYASTDTATNDGLAVQGHGTVQRVGAIIRSARLIGYHDSDEAVLWCQDANTNDGIELSETAVLWADSDTSELRLSTPFPSHAPGTTPSGDRAVAMNEFEAPAFPNTIRGNSGATTIVLSGNVAGVTIESNAAGADADLLNLRVELTSGQDEDDDGDDDDDGEAVQSATFVVSAAPVAPADYLQDASSNTNDGISGARRRRTIARSWEVP